MSEIEEFEKQMDKEALQQKVVGFIIIVAIVLGTFAYFNKAIQVGQSISDTVKAALIN